MKIKDLKYIKINSVNSLCFILKKVNGYFEEINGSKSLALVPTSEGEKKFKRYEELWIKIKYLIRPIIKSSDDYDEKYMKIKFTSDDALPLNKTIEILSMTIVVRAIFLENNKYYLQVPNL